MLLLFSCNISVGTRLYFYVEHLFWVLITVIRSFWVRKYKIWIEYLLYKKIVLRELKKVIISILISSTDDFTRDKSLKSPEYTQLSIVII